MDPHDYSRPWWQCPFCRVLIGFGVAVWIAVLVLTSSGCVVYIRANPPALAVPTPAPTATPSPAAYVPPATLEAR